MKTVYKLTPVDDLDLTGIENWLEEMALQGLYLEDYNSHYCRFRRGEPKRVRVRLEPNPRRAAENRLPKDKEDFYREAGWTFACEICHNALVFYNEDLSAPELHTDPTLLADRVRTLIQRGRRSIWFGLAIMVLFAVYLYHAHWRTFHLIQSLVLYVLFFLMIFLDCISLRRLKAIERDMEDGVTPERLSLPPRWRLLQLLASALWYLYFAIFFLAPIFLSMFGVNL